MRNLVNFNASSGKSVNLHFDVLLLSIAYKFSTYKVPKKKDLDIEEKLTFYLKNDMRNLANFNLSSGNLHICLLMGCSCRKCVIFELERYRGVV